jgi:hypothetical protein
MRQLTEDEYYEVQAQYDNTPPPDCEYSMATGEHWLLKSVLDRIGFYTPDTLRAYELAGELLSKGHSHENQSGNRFAYH